MLAKALCSISSSYHHNITGYNHGGSSYINNKITQLKTTFNIFLRNLLKDSKYHKKNTQHEVTFVRIKRVIVIDS